MIAFEREFLKAHRKLEQLVESVRRAGQEGRRIDEVERMLFAELLAMGRHLITAYVDGAGDGNAGETVDVPTVAEEAGAMPNEQPIAATRTLRRLAEPRTAAMSRFSGNWPSPDLCTARGRGRRSRRAPWTTAWDCRPATSLTCWKTGNSGSA